MRLFTLLLVCLCSFASFSYAQNNRMEYYNDCLKYKKSDAFCTCAVGEPYDQLITPSGNAETAMLINRLERMENEFDNSYNMELEKGGISASQLEAICDVVEEYYEYLDEIEVDYKSKSKAYAKSEVGARKTVVVLTQDQREKMTAKKTELLRRIHDLNMGYQTMGLGGSTSTLDRGACYMKMEINWLRKRITHDQQNAVEQATPAFNTKKLIVSASKTCAGL